MSSFTSKNANRTLSARGKKARKKLKEAAQMVLERKGYHEMKVVDITKEAGVATGLFYHYFTDTKALTLEVLTDFLQRFSALDEIEKGIDQSDWFSKILAHTKVFVESYAQHSGLMRCMLQLSDQESEFRALHKQCTMAQMNWFAKMLPQMFPHSTISNDEALLIVYSVSGTVESLLQEYYIAKSPLLCRKKLDVDEMSELAASMFYRAIFLQNPPKLTTELGQKLNHLALNKDTPQN